MDQSVKEKRRFSKDMISKPLNFEHRIHADTQAQAESVLREISKSPVVGNKLDLGRILGRKGSTKGTSRTPEYVPVSRSAPDKSPLDSAKPKTYYSLISELRDRHNTAAGRSNSTPVEPGGEPSPSSSPDDASISIPRGITKSNSTIGMLTLRPATQDPEDINELFISTPNPGGMPVNNGVSLVTKERSIAAKIYFENYFDRMCNAPTGRAKRRMQLEQGLQSMDIPDSEKRQIRSDWMATESEHMRQLRNKISIASFDILKTIGHGAFGVVKLVREKATGELYAMKIMRKADMLRKGQEGHVRAERDLLSKASESALWIVKLVYSFQDHDHLYLVMEYMPGGDLLSLLIKKDVFDEDFARPYVAEMVTCIEEAHKLGYVHRDVKPDNFLFDEYGHLRLSDFGLATDFHWAHDSAYYEAHRRELNAISAADQKADERDGFLYGDEESSISPSMYNGTPNDPGAPPTNRVLVWRENRRRKVAYSVVGTNNYIAPEVLRGSGYDKGCDWWSLGVIIFEMLYGYPPFCSKSRQNTKAKILNWQQTLAFPSKPRVSHEVRNLIENLICDRPNRLGCAPCDPNDSTNANGLGDAKDIKSHPWFRGINWDRLATAQAPFVPKLKSDTDTSYFDEIEGDATLPSPEDAGEGNNAAGGTADGDDEVFDMRKNLAFVGFTYRAVTKPKRIHRDREAATAAGGEAPEISAEGQEEEQRRGMSRASSF